MDEKDLRNLISSLFTEKIDIVRIGNGFKISLPFTDNIGDPIEVYAEIDDSNIKLDDIGHIAGILFQLGQHGSDTLGHRFVRSITNLYEIVMDYDKGVLSKDVSIHESSKILDFFQALTAIKTSLPEIRYRKQTRKRGKRLVALISREIKQLKLPLYVQQQAEIQGKNEIWTVDYKYQIRRNGKSSEVVITTADFKWGQPREKAAHALTLAVDILSLEKARDLRIIYDLDRNGNSTDSRRAAQLLEEHQENIGYRVYNYGNQNIKSALITQINQELSPYLFKEQV